MGFVGAAVVVVSLVFFLNFLLLALYNNIFFFVCSFVRSFVHSVRLVCVWIEWCVSIVYLFGLLSIIIRMLSLLSYIRHTFRTLLLPNDIYVV